jgi:hypothetical protein
MLKLMLILLAFFVFLVSRSEFAERKVAPILDSLALRFAAPVSSDGFVGIASVAPRGDPAALLRRHVLGHLPVSAAPVATSGAIIAFDLPRRSLFAGDQPMIARERRVLLHRLSEAVAGENAVSRPLLIVLTAWPQEDSSVVRAHFGALLAVLGDTSLPVGRLRFGFAHLPPDTWRFVIRSELADAF